MDSSSLDETSSLTTVGCKGGIRDLSWYGVAGQEKACCLITALSLSISLVCK